MSKGIVALRTELFLLPQIALDANRLGESRRKRLFKFRRMKARAAVVIARRPFPPLENTSMGTSFGYNHEVEALLRNIELRNALEPYTDDSVNKNILSHLSLDAENEYLFDILEWENAPLKPIYRWFNPPLCPPRPENVKDEDLKDILECIIQKLFEKHIVLEFTDHLSDRELYRVIWRNILPFEAKMIYSQKYMSWDCAHINGDPDVWLRYYASAEEREIWAETYELPMPPMELPKYPRHLPEKPE